MEIATPTAIRAVKEFTPDVKEQERILRYLSEVPLGDEYGYLEPSDWRLGQDFVDWARARGIDVWWDYPAIGEARFNALAAWNAEYSRIRKDL